MNNSRAGGQWKQGEWNKWTTHIWVINTPKVRKTRLGASVKARWVSVNTTEKRHLKETSRADQLQAKGLMPTSCDKDLHVCVCAMQANSFTQQGWRSRIFFFFAKCFLKCISCNVMHVEQWFAFAKVEPCSTLFLIYMNSQILDLDSLYQWSGCSSRWHASSTSNITFLPCYDVLLSGNEWSEKKNFRMGLGSRHYLLIGFGDLGAEKKWQWVQAWKLKGPVMAFFFIKH